MIVNLLTSERSIQSCLTDATSVITNHDEMAVVSTFQTLNVSISVGVGIVSCSHARIFKYQAGGKPCLVKV